MRWKVTPLGIMPEGARPARVLGLVFATLGALLLAGSGIAAAIEAAAQARMTEAEGRIFGMLAGERRDRGRVHAQWTPVFAFVAGGREVRVVAGFATSAPCRAVGDPVRVLQDPTTLDRARIAWRRENRIIALVLAGAGAVFSVPGLAALGIDRLRRTA
ncbi:DUF3592 domain-containing protein [Roseomonas sp. HF4]|uniref:DUF3592 domain-containing protein n=1 Tax=Roseomonas sp. HF4 TaxID=2562313 RepID=UPI001484D1B1|nr:DUF3592 domain-containing protein [Roseomonas sp. HF4]